MPSTGRRALPAAPCSTGSPPRSWAPPREAPAPHGRSSRYGNRSSSPGRRCCRAPRCWWPMPTRSSERTERSATRPRRSTSASYSSAWFAGPSACEAGSRRARRLLPRMNAWTSIQPEQAAEWNRRLLGTAASVYQYPYWNEPYRPLHLSPTYLVYGDHACPAAYVCVLSVRVPGGRIGLALRGPVVLGGETSLEPAWESLTRWARDSGYIFVRFSNSNAGLLDSIAGVGRSERVDPFPFFRDTPADVVVELRHDEQAMLASFSRNAHKDIRKASEAGYEVREAPPNAFADAWPMFQAHARRKGFRYNRPLSSWLEMIRLGQPYGCVGCHSVDLRGRRMAAFLMYRDGTTVHGISAVDAAALDRRPNPSALIHWQLMRHYRVLGCTYYDLGADTGSLYHFKQKFHPVKQQTSAPLTL